VREPASGPAIGGAAAGRRVVRVQRHAPSERSGWFRRVGQPSVRYSARTVSREPSGSHPKRQKHRNAQSLITAHGCGSVGRRVQGRGRTAAQVRGQWHGDLSTGAMCFDPAPVGTDARRTERRGEEKACRGCVRCNGNRNPHAGRSRDSGHVRPVQLRRAAILLPDEVVRGGEVLPCELPGPEDGRRQGWHPVRGAMVLLPLMTPRPARGVL